MTGNISSDWRKDAGISGEKPWEVPKSEILRTMRDDGGWFRFNEYSNIGAVIELLEEGSIEFDPDWNNRHSGMVTSIRARATA